MHKILITGARSFQYSILDDIPISYLIRIVDTLSNGEEMWRKLRKLISLKKLSYILLISLFFILMYLFNWVNKPPRQFINREEKTEHYKICHRGPKEADGRRLSDSRTIVNSRTRQQALVFLVDGYTSNGKQIITILQSVRFKFHTQYGTVRNLPALIDNDKLLTQGRYSVIIFEDIDTYLQLNSWNKEILDKYCTGYDVGLLLFFPSNKKKSVRTVVNKKLSNFPLYYVTNVEIKNYRINTDSDILRITRAGDTLKGNIPGRWTIFSSNHSTYDVVSMAALQDPKSIQSENLFEMRNTRQKRSLYRKRSDLFQLFGITNEGDEAAGDINQIHNPLKEEMCTTVIRDNGLYDGINRVIFGGGLEFWLHQVLFLDALSYLSHSKLIVPLVRYVQIDIDDIFVSAVGARMHEDDVMALIKFQKEMKNRIEGFHFLLGFSGKFFQRGTPKENAGDMLFLKQQHNFVWFPHMWSHMQAQWFSNESRLCEYMEPNRQFSERHGFNVSTGYSVAPHHAGIYPVHEPLYSCWKKIWGIQVSSTEEYPALRPDHKRRGFVYKGIKVLPRQTCGLFTHTNFLNKYPGGREKLDDQITGGSLFRSFLLSQYLIFMTHFSNYGSDRLGLYVFDRVVDFVQCWTNLRLVQIPPLALAEKYFNEYPDEVDPIWTNPCADSRHLEIWAKEKTCDRLPKFVIAGPQKTGTTALHWFLLMHPNVASTKPSPQTFEEVQFFNGQNYFNGLDWYMDFFPLPNENTETILFEKSANYFDTPIVPKRFSALLPKAHIIILLSDPGKRAYSWYQHMLSHNDPTAANYTFYEVIKAKKKGSPSNLLLLQSRCLQPGLYSEHLDRWLMYMPSGQIIIEDSELLTKNPVKVLHRLEDVLSLPTFNYSNAVRYDESKGFFCQVSNADKNKCLGKGKGRKYPEMSEKSRVYLQDYYKDSNKRLLQLLKDIKQPIPQWLQNYFVSGT